MRRPRSPAPRPSRAVALAGLLAVTRLGCSSEDGAVRGFDDPSLRDASSGDASSHDAPGEAGDASSHDAPGEAGVGGAPAGDATTERADTATAPPPCPHDMVLVEDFCVDRYEAPNRADELPFVMFTFDEAESWCAARGKRLCFDDEWTRACEGTAGNAYPYGQDHQPGVCNDEEIWRLYDQSKLNSWPINLATDGIETLEALLAAAAAKSAPAAAAADHVSFLYQGERAGENVGCASDDAVLDLVGNVEEWTRRRDGGAGADFSGSLKGRYWAESRTCQSAVTTHGNAFRFYEIGFRCCRLAQ